MTKAYVLMRYKDLAIVFEHFGNHHADFTDEEVIAGQRYYYGEHTCPTNYLSNVITAIDLSKRDIDPHGIFEFVKIAKSSDGEPNDIESLSKLFGKEFTDLLGPKENERPPAEELGTGVTLECSDFTVTFTATDGEGNELNKEVQFITYADIVKNYTYELAYYDEVTEEYVQSIPLNMTMDEARMLFNISQSEYPGDCLLVESVDQLRKVLEGYSNYDLPVEYKAGCYFVEILAEERGE